MLSVISEMPVDLIRGMVDVAIVQRNTTLIMIKSEMRWPSSGFARFGSRFTCLSTTMVQINGQKPEQQHVLQFLSTAEMGSFYAEPDGVDQRVDHVDQQDDREKIFH